MKIQAEAVDGQIEEVEVSSFDLFLLPDSNVVEVLRPAVGDRVIDRLHEQEIFTLGQLRAALRG